MNNDNFYYINNDNDNENNKNNKNNPYCFDKNVPLDYNYGGLYSAPKPSCLEEWHSIPIKPEADNYIDILNEQLKEIRPAINHYHVLNGKKNVNNNLKWFKENEKINDKKVYRIKGL